ncbi:toxin-antitoxin system YwqK family antitoxin [Alkalimonas mucilaginosa]|uniref:Uncharacterized protein n=1 Tax=Alkalimonas mucilaginosa TaxID=3057676 RepID=A0ABU7JHV4_9GAMM|nr:hypothetical protein [Alkalimonas sp. MEB004]MEE2025279.1 hypothetical protein [Alkalimonas sp. MEB004]
MKGIVFTIVLLLSSPFVAAGSVWLDGQMRPVDEAEASYVLAEISELAEGYRMRVNYLSGELRYETFIDHKDVSQATQVGDYRLYFKSGQLLQEGSRDQQGRYQGIVKTYHENGKLHRKIPYRDNLVHGIYTIYFEDGSLQRKQEVKDHKRHGRDLSYHPNGELRVEVNYVDGNREGVSRLWNEEGVLMRQRNYRNGQVDGVVEEYFDDGQLKSRGEYKHRQRVGEHELWYANGQLRRYQLFDQDGKVQIERTLRQDGSMQRNMEPVQADFGPATVTEEYNQSGQLTRRTTTSDDKQWYRSERYTSDGELTEWHQTLNRKRHGRSFLAQRGRGYTEAYYIEGQRHGDYREVNADGEVRVSGTFDHGKRIGNWYQHLGTDQFYEFYDAEGRLHGERKQLDADDQLLLHEHYHHGKRHGAVLAYRDGQLVSEGHYVDGERDGFWKISEGYRDVSRLEGHYTAGVQVGEWRRYSANGYLLGISHFNNQGQLHGREFRFEENGALLSVIDYKEAVRHGEEWWYFLGSPMMLRLYQNGEFVKEKILDDPDEFY